MGRNAEPRKNWGRREGRKKKRIVVHSSDSFERKEKEGDEMRPDQGLEEQKQDSNNFSAFLGEGLSPPPPPPPPPILFHQCERKEKGKRRRKLLSGGKERKEGGKREKPLFSFLFSSRGLRPPTHHWCSLLHKASYSSHSSQAQAPDRGGPLSLFPFSFQTHGRRTSLFAIVKWGGGRGGSRGGGYAVGGGEGTLCFHILTSPQSPPFIFVGRAPRVGSDRWGPAAMDNG